MVLACYPCTLQAKPAGEGALTKKTLLKGAAKLVRAVRRQRRLRLRRKLKMEVLDREELGKRREAYIAGRLAERDLALEGEVLIRLGALERGIDLKKLLGELLTAGEPGPFYNHRNGKLNIAGWRSIKDQRPALSLGVCHALVDQRFRVRRLLKRAAKNRDAWLARRALIEGDCAALIMEMELRRHGMELSNLGQRGEELLRRALAAEGLERSPPFLRERLLFPYLAGQAFVSRVRARHSWSLVNRVYNRPPESCEQVLQYDRYWNRDRPDRIRTRKLPALEAMPEVWRDTLGEAQISWLLRPGVDTAAAVRAAQGWGGDLLVAHRTAAEQVEGELPSPLLLIHLTSWDSPLDAREFAGAQRHQFQARGLKLASSEAGSWVYSDAEEAVWSQRLLGRQVLTLIGAPAELHERLLEQVIAKWRVNGRRLK